MALVSGPVLGSVDGVDPTSSHLWSSVKGDTYSEREHFAKGVAQMSARFDAQIGELKAKRNGMVKDTDDWDFAMKDVENSRAMLTDRISILSQAKTPESWSEAKDKIGEAWHRAQLAVDNMNGTRTS